MCHFDRFDHVNDVRNPSQFIETYRETVVLQNGRFFSNTALAPVLKACSKIKSLHAGKQIHAQAIKFSLSSDVYVQTSLMSMYSSCDQYETSLKLFDQMPNRSIVTWTALMDLYLKWDQPRRTIAVFCKMLRTGIHPDHFSIVSALAASARLGILNFGRWVHCYIIKDGIELSVFIGTALIDMYCKGGSIDEAILVFDFLPNKSIQTWNSMIHGFSFHGRVIEALELFTKMEIEEQTYPNEITFVGLLSGCSHKGLVEEGKAYFDIMQRKYRIRPTIKHYGCMVDLLGRAGLIAEAFEMVKKMPIPHNAIILGSLLSACRSQNNLVVAERLSKMIGEIEGESFKNGDTSHYVILSNIYNRAGLKDKMAKTRMKIGKKPKGVSVIERGSEVHEFAVGDASHPEWGEIKLKLNEIMEKIGRKDWEEGDFVNIHSEKVATAFGLLRINNPLPVKIVKNLRICEDCHEVLKLISGIYDRELVVRDCTRFHRFRAGHCSCKDYW